MICTVCASNLIVYAIGLAIVQRRSNKAKIFSTNSFTFPLHWLRKISLGTRFHYFQLLSPLQGTLWNPTNSNILSPSRGANSLRCRRSLNDILYCLKKQRVENVNSKLFYTISLKLVPKFSTIPQLPLHQLSHGQNENVSSILGPMIADYDGNSGLWLHEYALQPRA